MMSNESLRSPEKSTVTSEGESATRCATPIERLELSAHAYDILRQAGCRTVDDVLARWPERVLRLNGVGPRLVHEVYESLHKVVPNRASLWPSDVFRGRVSVQVPYSPDRNIFLNNAMAQWEACVQKDRERERGSRSQMQRTVYERASLEDDIKFLSLWQRGMAPWRIAQEKKCSSAAVYARKRRLVVRYAHPIRLQGLPPELREFVIQTSRKYVIATKP
jgi:hypothetical protein